MNIVWKTLYQLEHNRIDLHKEQQLFDGHLIQ